MNVLVTGGSLVTGRLISNNHLLLDMTIKGEREKNGCFKRVHSVWNLDNFNDGYVTKEGRFSVYIPTHFRANTSGYIFRSIAAFEAYHNISVPPDMDVHHIDNNRLNDSKDNLALLPHSEHASLSNQEPESNVIRICKHCGKEFVIKRGRLSEPTRGTFCSQKCYQEHPKSEITKQRQSESLKKAYEEGRRGEQ